MSDRSVRLPAPVTLSDIRHPGPRSENRLPHAMCHADPVTIHLEPGEPLLSALGRCAETAGYASAVLDLSGVHLSGFDFVMPDRAIDDRHAAWYSDTHTSSGAVLEEAIAILGWRDGDWFAHIHAFWRDNGEAHLGHLLPHSLGLGEPATLSGYGISGARFEAEPDAETEFTLYRVKPDPDGPKGRTANALIATLAPFTDLYHGIGELSQNLSVPSYSVLGLGSLAGAVFDTGKAMTGLISEILLRHGAGTSETDDLILPLRTVDLDGVLFEGTAFPGRCPTLVTNELLLVEQ